MQSARNFKKYKTAHGAVYATEDELLRFLYFLDTNPVIQKFLQYDNSFRLADKYLIAMVFVYFKRAQLTPEDYTHLNFFAGLCLAHSMEEDIALFSEIYDWALGEELKDELPKLLELKTLLWVAMDYRAAVSRHCCKQMTIDEEMLKKGKSQIKRTKNLMEVVGHRFALIFFPFNGIIKKFH